jgi:hypothetical protein
MARTREKPLAMRVEWHFDELVSSGLNSSAWLAVALRSMDNGS